MNGRTALRARRLLAPEPISAVLVLLGTAVGLLTVPTGYAGVRDDATFERVVGLVSHDLVRFVAACVGVAAAVALASALAAGAIFRAFGIRRARTRALCLAAGWYLFLLAACVRAPALFEDGLMRLPPFHPRLVFAISKVPALGWTVWTAGLWLLPAAVAIALVVAAFRWRRRAGAAAIAAGLALVAWLAAPHVRAALELGRVTNRSAAPRQKSVLVVAFDSFRADHLAKPVEGRPATPNLAELARRSLYLPTTIVPVARTAPALVSLFVSQYPVKTGVSSMFPLPEHWDQRGRSLATLFRENGYRTFAVGDYVAEFLTKIDLGFDRVSAPVVELPELAAQNVLLRQPVLLALLTHPALRARVPDPFDRVVSGYPQYSDPHDVLRRLLEEIAEADRLGQPFFGFLFLSPPHFPYAALFPDYAAFADPGYDGPFRFKKDAAAWAAGDADRRQVRALYAGALRMVDALVPDLERLAAGRGAGLVVTGDHGELLYDGPDVATGHGDVLRYGFSYEVPLLFHDPDGRWPRRTEPSYARSIDVAPTLVDLLARGHQGLLTPDTWGRDDAAASWDGVSLLDLDPVRRRADPFAFDTIAYSETELWMMPDATGGSPRIPYPGIAQLLEPLPERDGRLALRRSFVPLFLHAKYRMIRSNDLKFVYRPTRDGALVELYDVRADPEERHDLSAREPALVARFRETLRRLLLGYRDGFADAP